MEPTGHYWYNLAAYLQAHGMVVVHMSPSHVKKSKELDDNNPNKNDRKDPKTIAGLVTEGRYMFPYMPNGIYASIREVNNMRMRATESLVVVKNRLARWFSIYFPEFTAVFGDLKAKSARLLLAEAPHPMREFGYPGIEDPPPEDTGSGCFFSPADSFHVSPFLKILMFSL